ncbi:hypothetical protein HDU98_002901 [Podochytrium sp. JEL0797]|nr:hypothetical protein HDU98_002901 [Podochytrium sp. JEL0797]
MHASPTSILATCTSASLWTGVSTTDEFLQRLAHNAQAVDESFPALRDALSSEPFASCFTSSLLPAIVQWASGSGDNVTVTVLPSGFDSSTARLVLANMFLLNTPWTSMHVGSLSLRKLYTSKRPVAAERIKCLLGYFTANLKPTTTRTIEIDWPVPQPTPDWTSVTTLPLPLVCFIPCMESSPARRVVDFANKYIHVHEIIASCTQEESLFSSCPEAFLAIGLCPKLEDDEVLVIRGVTRFVGYTGQGDSFTYSGVSGDAKVMDILVMDAVQKNHFVLDSVTRDLNKAFQAFSSQPTGTEGGPDSSPDTAVVTGHWGCGVFGGDKTHKFIQQWCAASVSGVWRLDYATRDVGLTDFWRDLMGAVALRGWSVARVCSELLEKGVEVNWALDARRPRCHLAARRTLHTIHYMTPCAALPPVLLHARASPSSSHTRSFAPLLAPPLFAASSSSSSSSPSCRVSALRAALADAASSSAVLFKRYIALSLSQEATLLSPKDVDTISSRLIQEAIATRSIPRVKEEPSPHSNPSIFIKVLCDASHPNPPLLDHISQLLPITENDTIPQNKLPSLPSLLDNFSRLLLSDIARLKLAPSLASTTLPSLLLLRKLSTTAEASTLLSTVSSLRPVDRSSPTSATDSHDCFNSAVIAALGVSGHSDLAHSFFKSLDASRIGVYPYLSLIRVLLSDSKMDDALVVTLELLHHRQESVKIRQSTVNGILKTLLNSTTMDTPVQKEWVSKLVRVFWKRVSRMRADSVALFRQGTGSHAAFLEILVKHYARCNDVESVLSLSRHLDDNNVALSIYANNTILSLFFALDKRPIAYLLFKDMSKSNRLNIYTLNIMLARLAERSPQSALNLFASFQHLHPTILPDIVTYTTVMDISFKMGWPDRATAFYHQMTSAGLQPTLITCTSLMDGLLKSGNLPAAAKLFTSFTHTPRDTTMHTSMIHNLSLLEDDASLKQRYTRFQNDPHLVPDLVLFNVLLRYFLKTKQTEASLHVLHELDSLRLEPDSYTSTAVVYGLMTGGEYAAVEACVGKMVRNGLPGSVHGLAELLRALASVGDVVAMVRWLEAVVGVVVVSGDVRVMEELTRFVGVGGGVKERLGVDKDVMGLVAGRLGRRRMSGCGGGGGGGGGDGELPDFKFFVAVVNGLIRNKAVETADAVVRYMVVAKVDGVVDGVVDGRVHYLVERVGSLWREGGHDERAVEVLGVLARKQVIK